MNLKKVEPVNLKKETKQIQTLKYLYVSYS